MAKNLLVSLSHGENVASFLDMALLEKSSNGSLVNDGLDGGESCSTLNQVEKKGYCPQKYSSSENGDRNFLIEDIIGETHQIYQQSAMLKILKDFLKGKETFGKNDSRWSHKILSNAQSMINQLKSNPKLKIPFPVARFDIPEKWILRQTYNQLKKRAGQSFLEEDKFYAEYDKEYSKFYPKYIQSLLDGKNLEQVFGQYQISMDSFIKKYGIQGEMNAFRQNFLRSAIADYEDADFKKNMRDSMDFFKRVTGKTDATDQDFTSTCLGSFYQESKFISDIRVLTDYLNENSIDTADLFDKNGQLKSANDLMQLIVAPACLNPENRTKLDFRFSCDTGYRTVDLIKTSVKSRDDQIVMLRKRVVSGLIQGFASGNTFIDGQDAHINTIVGIRFNKETGSCEYNIRESQTGRSDWKLESEIFARIRALTEVRRK